MKFSLENCLNALWQAKMYACRFVFLCLCVLDKFLLNKVICFSLDIVFSQNDCIKILLNGRNYSEWTVGITIHLTISIFPSDNFYRRRIDVSHNNISSLHFCYKHVVSEFLLGTIFPSPKHHISLIPLVFCMCWGHSELWKLVL